MRDITNLLKATLVDLYAKQTHVSKKCKGKKKKTCRKYNHRNLFSKGLNRLSVNNVITFLAKE